MNPEQQFAQILIVDDEPNNIDILSNVLSDEFDILAATNGAKAIEIACKQSPQAILLDVMMPNMDGYEVCQHLKKDPATSEIPVIFVTSKTEDDDEAYGLSIGAVDYIAKPISPPIVKTRVKTQISLHNQNRLLQNQVAARTSELHETQLKIIQRLGRAAEYRDNETGFHVIRMSHYARLIAEAYGGNPYWVDLLYNAAPMHDVGKIGIPDHILLKPGRLDDDEMTIMRRHCEFGAEILGMDDNPLLQLSRSIALTHHEKWDGSGYPNSLSGEDIPLEGRITAIADVFDALTSERPYKKAWDVEDAANFIQENSGSHFDPNLAALFDRVFDDVLKIKSEYKDNDVA